MRRTAAALTSGLLTLVLLLTGCAADGEQHEIREPRTTSPTATGPSGSTGTTGSARSAGQVETIEYRPGMSATITLPSGGDPAAVMVLVPGGSWTTADPTGLSRLAPPFAEAGLATVTITYGTDSTGDHFPVPVQDVACALGLAADRAPDVPLVVLGHSAGAHLAVLTALAPELGQDGGPGCVAPPRPADAAIGLAGPYDVDATVGVAARLFGAARAEEPGRWVEGNPLTWSAERPDLPFLLVHGDADHVVSTSFTTDLADALLAAGHPTTVEILPGVGHNDVFAPEVVAELVTSWVVGTVLAGSSGSRP